MYEVSVGPLFHEHKIQHVPVPITTVLKAVAVIAFFVAYHYALPKIGRRIGDMVRRTFAHFFSPLLTARSRRKAISDMQEDRRKRGLPPLENPLL